MASKTRTPTPTVDPVVPTDTPATVAHPTGESSATPLPTTTETTLTLEQLRESRKQIEVQIKALKGTAKPARKETPLSEVIARQHELPGRWVVLGLAVHVNDRINAGQDADEALSQVAARYAAIVKGVLASRRDGENLQVATWRLLHEQFPKTDARTGPGAKPEQATA